MLKRALIAMVATASMASTAFAEEPAPAPAPAASAPTEMSTPAAAAPTAAASAAPAEQSSLPADTACMPRNLVSVTTTPIRFVGHLFDKIFRGSKAPPARHLCTTTTTAGASPQPRG